MLKSLLIAVATVATTAVLILLDPLLLRAFHAVAPRVPAVERIAEAMEYTLAPGVVIGGVVLYALLVRAARWRRPWIIVGTAIAQGLFIGKLKDVFCRMRPDDLMVSFGFYGPKWHSAYNSFPGGHAAGSFALAALFAHWHPRWGWAFYSAATIITLSRIYLDRHFFSDCFIGASLGYWIARTFLYYLEPREVLKPEGDRATFLELDDGEEPA